MTRTAQFLVFIGIVLSIMALAHFYVWWRLVYAPAPPHGVKRVLTGVLLLLYLSIPMSFFATRASTGARKFFALPGNLWLGVLFILFASFLAVDALRFVGAVVHRLVAEAPPVDPTRRTAIARLLASAVVLFTGGASAAALRSALGPVTLRTVRVPLARLPKALDGFTIVQISDVHVGPTIGRAFVEDVVRRVNTLSPDLVAVTGDLVDGSVETLAGDVAPLAELRAKHGVFFVTGNHEYYSGVDEWCDHVASLGMRVLRNEHVTVGEGEASFDLAGVDDHEALRFGGVSNVERAVAGRETSRELVLLAHQPRAAYDADRHGVGLQLSGHTHGGQIWPWRYLVALQQPVVAGLGRVGNTAVYVSSGTGYWGPPMRLAAPAEITKIVLESASS